MFRVMKCQFGYRKVRYRGIAKNGAQVFALGESLPAKVVIPKETSINDETPVPPSTHCEK